VTQHDPEDCTQVLPRFTYTLLRRSLTAGIRDLGGTDMALKKILLAYNGAVASEQDLQWGLNVVRQTLASTVIIQIIQPQNLSGRNNRRSDGQGNGESGLTRSHLLDVAANALVGRELSATATVLVGDPTLQIIRLAEREQVDLILYSYSDMAELAGNTRSGTRGIVQPERRKSRQYVVYSLRAIAGR